ncbi:MAG: hypothetical protein ACRCX2_20910 [Paraclostridium sp.]
MNSGLKEMEMDDEYVRLLGKFCFDEDIYKLIDAVINDDVRVSENIYLATNKYPEKRNLLMKLKVDLATKKKCEVG